MIESRRDDKHDQMMGLLTKLSLSSLFILLCAFLMIMTFMLLSWYDDMLTTRPPFRQDCLRQVLLLFRLLRLVNEHGVPKSSSVIYDFFILFLFPLTFDKVLRAQSQHYRHPEQSIFWFPFFWAFLFLQPQREDVSGRRRLSCQNIMSHQCPRLQWQLFLRPLLYNNNNPRARRVYKPRLQGLLCYLKLLRPLSKTAESFLSSNF